MFHSALRTFSPHATTSTYGHALNADGKFPERGDAGVTQLRNAPTHSETTLLFIRHAHTAAIGVWLCGRQSGVCLSASGQTQSRALGIALDGAYALTAIYTSPLERARETANTIARRQGACVTVADDLIEIDYGSWTGRTFDALAADPRWRTFNRARSRAIVPDGEQLVAAQVRIVAAASRIAAAHRGGVVALITHAELIRLALMHYLSMPLDAYDQLSIDPASISEVRINPPLANVLSVNRLPTAT